MSLDNKQIFLAGATGLVGTGVLRHLLSKYQRIVIRASYFKPIKPFIKDRRVQYVAGDLREEDDARRMVRGCDACIMAAATTAGARGSVLEPWKQVDDNVVMNTRLLSALAQEKVKRAVFIGSATLYQEFEGSIREGQLDLNKDPASAYMGIGWVTRFVEKLCAFWHKAAGIEVVLARAANVFGPYARFDPATSNFIPAIIRKAIDKQDPFEVWGSPEVTRDVIYVEDCARAIVTMLEKEDIKFDCFNIGSGVRTTVGDVVKWALKYASHQPKEVRYLTDKPTTIGFRSLDISKAKAVLGWEPTIGIEEGVRRTTEWWQDNRRAWRR